MAGALVFYKTSLGFEMSPSGSIATRLHAHLGHTHPSGNSAISVVGDPGRVAHITGVVPLGLGFAGIKPGKGGPFSSPTLPCDQRSFVPVSK